MDRVLRKCAISIVFMWYMYSTLLSKIGIIVAFHPCTPFIICPILYTSCNWNLRSISENKLPDYFKFLW